MRIWFRMFVRERNLRGLTKNLVLVDNADVHINPEVNALFIKHKVCLLGLFKSGTGF